MPDAILDRMGTSCEQRGCVGRGSGHRPGEMLAAVRDSVQGVQVSAPFSKFAAAAEVLGLEARTREEVAVGA